MEKNVILLIEDDPLDVISVQRSLNKLDIQYELFTAFNGVEGLTFLENRVKNKEVLPHVLLLDLNMPKMSGIEFLRKLRDDQLMSSIKVFVMTTSADDKDRNITKQLGVSGYIIKPLNFTNNNKRTDSMDAFVQFHLRRIFNEMS
jgi:CheY-like chemotaxis protein